MQQMQEALAQQEAMLRELTAEREASRELRKKIASSSTSERLHDASAAVAAVREEPPLSDVDVLAGGDLKLVPSAIAVVVIAYNRPHYLDEALRSINASHPGGDSYPVYVSQDGENKGVADMARKHGARSLVHPRKIIEFTRGTYLSKNPGYAYLSVHYGWALRTLFGMGIGASRGAGSSASAGGGGPYAGVIILEEDIRVAADFFSYFSATAPLLESDPTLLCVSAFNDNGQDAYPGDARALHRSDFFPGLGWLLTRRLWTELAPKWPEAAGFWDDWLREGPQRKGRASIRPEVSRTVTFGEKGTSVGQFYKKYLAKISLNSQGVDWAREDLRYLSKGQYETQFDSWVQGATVVHSLESARRQAESDRVGTDLLLRYRDQSDFVSLCKRLGLMEDLKAGVPRTAYHGVVLVRINGRRLFLAPNYKVDQDITADGHGIKPGRRVA